MLSALDPFLSTELLADVFAAARAVGWKIRRTELASAFNTERLREVLQNAVKQARATVDESARTIVLVDVAPHLEAGLLSSALVAALCIKDEKLRSDALSAIAPHLSRWHVRELLRRSLLHDRRRRLSLRTAWLCIAVEFASASGGTF